MKHERHNGNWWEGSVLCSWTKVTKKKSQVTHAALEQTDIGKDAKWCLDPAFYCEAASPDKAIKKQLCPKILFYFVSYQRQRLRGKRLPDVLMENFDG